VLIKLQSVVVADRKVCGTYNRKQMNLLYRGEVIVDKLGRLRGPAIFVVNNSTEVYVGQKMQRSFWSYGAVDKSVINRRSVTEEVQEREVYGDISSEEITSHHLSWDLNARTILQHCMLAASILAMETVKYISWRCQCCKLIVTFNKFL